MRIPTSLAAALLMVTSTNIGLADDANTLKRASVLFIAVDDLKLCIGLLRGRAGQDAQH